MSSDIETFVDWPSEDAPFADDCAAVIEALVGVQSMFALNTAHSFIETLDKGSSSTLPSSGMSMEQLSEAASHDLPRVAAIAIAGLDISSPWRREADGGIVIVSQPKDLLMPHPITTLLLIAAAVFASFAEMDSEQAEERESIGLMTIASLIQDERTRQFLREWASEDCLVRVEELRESIEKLTGMS